MDDRMVVVKIRDVIREMEKRGVSPHVIRMNLKTAMQVQEVRLDGDETGNVSFLHSSLRLFTSPLIPVGTILVDDGSADEEWARIEREGI